MHSLTQPLVVAVALSAAAVGQQTYPPVPQPDVPEPVVAVAAETLYTAEGPPIRNGVVVFGLDGKVMAVGRESSTPIPRRAGRIIRCTVATPGLVDARSVVGLAGYLNQDQDQDQLDANEPMQPELRALDAYDTREPLVDWIRNFGVTTVHTGHAPAALIPGQMFVVKTAGRTVDDAVVREVSMVAATLGPAATRSGKPGNRSKAVAMLRGLLEQGRGYLAKKRAAEAEERGDDGDGSDRAAAPEVDLRLEAIARVLAGEIPLLIHAQRSQDILTALRIRDEYGFEMVLDGGAEAYLVLDELEAAGVPVIAHPPMARHRGDLRNATFQLGARLADAGIPFAYQSGYESYVPKTRVVLFEAAIGAAHGLGFERALRAVTIDAAEILGVADRIGSLAPGKDGDVACYDGDPFEYTTHCVATIIDGRLVFEGER